MGEIGYNRVIKRRKKEKCMTLAILKNVMSDSIIRKATLELREWEFIHLSLVEMEFDASGIECANHIKSCLNEIKHSMDLFEDPEFTLVQYKPWIEKVNTEIQENYNRLMNFEFEDGGKSVIEDNKPSDYQSLIGRDRDKYVEIRNVFKDGKTISDFKKIEGFDPDLTQREIRDIQSKLPKKEFLKITCARYVFSKNTEVFIQYDHQFLGNFPDFKERVCEAVYDRFLNNPELLKLER